MIESGLFDVLTIRKDFLILNQTVNGRPLIYFDNAASSQKPTQVINSISKYYKTIHSNVHRGVHTLSQKATDAFETTRKKVQQHIGAKHLHEIIYTKGATESINLVAQSMTSLVKQGDEILISGLEHHSNIVPWQMLCERTGAILKVIPFDQRGVLDQKAYDALLTNRTKIVAVNHVSNALGTINPIKEMIQKAHDKKAWVLIDGAQSVPHLTIDVQELDADFYAFSSHKMCGPTGIGVLYGKKKWLNELPPYHGGGEMIKEVTFEKTTYNELPFKFEAGTPNIAATIAFGVAIDYLNQIGMDQISDYEQELLQYAIEQLSTIDGLEFIGTSKDKASVLSFNLKGIHPFDVGMILDKRGIAVRTGHHCAQPIMTQFGIPGTVRASFAFYNTKEEINQLGQDIRFAKKMLS